MRVVMLGLSITSSWGNGHATNFRGLVQGLVARGHDVLFLERDVPWYAAARDLAEPPFGRTELYASVDELQERFAADVAGADLVLVGSYVPDGIEVGEWVVGAAGGVRAFYDLDTPVTVAALGRGDCAYLTPALIARYDLYLSFTGGPVLDHIEQVLGSPRARAFHCLVDPGLYRPAAVPARWELGYLGTYSDDRQPVLDGLLCEPARRRPHAAFVVAGPQYPAHLTWPANVERVDHVAPAGHPAFYGAQRFTLNVTRADMVAAGWSPSVRLFEAAACGVPVISDCWEGIDRFFRPGEEILLAGDAEDVLRHLGDVDDARRAAIGAAARRRVLAEHTGSHRAAELEGHVAEAQARRRSGVEPSSRAGGPSTDGPAAIRAVARFPSVQFVFPRCRVLVDEAARYVESRMEDGTKVGATPNGDHWSQHLSVELGYGGDTWAMSRDHELSHTWLAHREGKPWSATMWRLAHPGSPEAADDTEVAEEEARVLEFQRSLDKATARPWEMAQDVERLPLLW